LLRRWGGRLSHLIVYGNKWFIVNTFTLYQLWVVFTGQPRETLAHLSYGKLLLIPSMSLRKDWLGVLEMELKIPKRWSTVWHHFISALEEAHKSI